MGFCLFAFLCVFCFLFFLISAALSVTILLLCLKDGVCGLPQLCHVVRKSRYDHRTNQISLALDIVSTWPLINGVGSEKFSYCSG